MNTLFLVLDPSEDSRFVHAYLIIVFTGIIVSCMHILVGTIGILVQRAIKIEPLHACA